MKTESGVEEGMDTFVILLKTVVEAPNRDQAVEACKGVADEVAVQAVKVINPEVVENLSTFLPHLGIALEAAKIDYPDATLQLGVLASNPDGSGKVIARLELTFVDDLRTLVDECSNPGLPEPEQG